MSIPAFFTQSLRVTDPELFASLEDELERQQMQIELIPSENYASMAVREAQASAHTNKYAEGYVGKRYYGGCEYVDIAEKLAIERLCQLFGCTYANVQPHSGSQANQAAFMALMKPGDDFMGMQLDQGGHLTHGHKVNASAKLYSSHQYGLNDKGLLDYEAIRKQALDVKPKVIIAGATCYPQIIDFEAFGAIAKEVGAYLMADIAHIAGLVAAGEHPSPFPHADIVTTTTHKTLRGPRGGVLMTNNEDIAKKINRAVFPGLQGGPLMHIIAAKAVAFKEALEPEFKAYAAQIVKNSRALAASLHAKGIDMVTGGTENHLLWLDLRNLELDAVAAQDALDRAGLTTNRNTVPNDPQPPLRGSGIRFGTPAATTRGFKEDEFTHVGTWVAHVLHGLANGADMPALEADVKSQVIDLCKQFPIYEK